jgi:hypothetical protein
MLLLLLPSYARRSAARVVMQLQLLQARRPTQARQAALQICQLVERHVQGLQLQVAIQPLQLRDQIICQAQLPQMRHWWQARPAGKAVAGQI